VCAATLAWLAMPSVSAYVYCGAHDRRFEMRAYHFNSEFWVDMLEAEARKWNAVHPVFNINRERNNRVPLGRDNQNVIAWIGEAGLNNVFNTSWGSDVGLTAIWIESGCGRVLEADVMFNPSVTLFTPQIQVPYSLGYQEIALHELGHVATLDHEDGSLAVMTTNNAVSDVLHHNDKVGWLRSARQRFNPLPTERDDMGIFPIRNAAGSKTYTTLSPASVARGDRVTVQNFSVENLSSVFAFDNPVYRVFLENTVSGVATDIGSFSWGRFGPFSSWSGNLTYTVPRNIPAGQYRVTAQFQGRDSDTTNDRALFGTVQVR
jgi:hypothetical protein